MNPVIIIPAYQPDSRLLSVIEQLVALVGCKIVVVDDGSDKASDDCFTRLAQHPQVEVIRHPKNMGKGAALRTGFAYVLRNERGCGAVITADADGQHTPEDIRTIVDMTKDSPGHLILGSRQFTGYVPLRSRLGNKLTRWLYNKLFCQELGDTQTGLRGIPVDLLETIITLKAERYSYELAMLVCLNRMGVPVVEVPIATVYEEDNSSSHFRPLLDSIQIYVTLLGLWLRGR